MNALKGSVVNRHTHTHKGHRGVLSVNLEKDVVQGAISLHLCQSRKDMLCLLGTWHTMGAQAHGKMQMRPAYGCSSQKLTSSNRRAHVCMCACVHVCMCACTAAVLPRTAVGMLSMLCCVCAAMLRFAVSSTCDLDSRRTVFCHCIAFHQVGRVAKGDEHVCM